MLGHALTVAGIAHDRGRFDDGHYLAMAEVDRARSAPEVVTDYMGAFLRAVGVPEDEVAAGARRPRAGARGARSGISRCPGARAAGARLAAAGVSPGGDQQLGRDAWPTCCAATRSCRSARGPASRSPTSPTRASSGCHKPDAAMFEATAAGLGLPLGRICHIGDAGGYDADGAAAAGMLAVHVDPLGLCPADHVHVTSLADFADRLLGVG